MADPKPRSSRPRSRSAGSTAAPKRRSTKVVAEPEEVASTPVDTDTDTDAITDVGTGGSEVAIVDEAPEEAAPVAAPSWAKPMRWFTRPSSATRRGWEAEAKRRAEQTDIAG